MAAKPVFLGISATCCVGKFFVCGCVPLTKAEVHETTGTLTYTYEYDNAGNLTKWIVRDKDGFAWDWHKYSYENSEWKDLLTALDGKSITYDANGNPTKYYNGATMTWRNGRQLGSYSLGGKTYSYEYDVNGLRTKRSHADGGYTEYYIIDGLAVGEQRKNGDGTERYTLRYLYDESNRPVGFGMQYPGETTWINYYFEKNVQGDVIAVYEKQGDGSSATRVLAARYRYDPYGNPLSITNGSGTEVSQTSNTIAAINPFRYRGYRYDGETGLYYLQSRYYDPVTCRFVNADKYASTGQGQLGHNMFAYCNNNPVRYDDPTGAKLDGLYTYVNDGGSSSSIRNSSGKSSETVAPSDPDPVLGLPNGCLTVMCGSVVKPGSLTDPANFVGMLGTYNELRKMVAGMGLEVHHLIEKRFLAVDEVAKIFKSPGEMPCVVLEKEQHRIYTNNWRAEYPYGGGYNNVTYQGIIDFCRSEYGSGGPWICYLEEWMN